jgi:hypothetical protein
VNQRCPSRRCRYHAAAAVAGSDAAAAGFFKELTRRGSGRFFKIHRGSGSIFFEDIEKVHEFDRILVFTSETS